MVIIIIKDKEDNIKDTILSIEIRFLHYMKMSMVMLQVVINFEEFQYFVNFSHLTKMSF